MGEIEVQAVNVFVTERQGGIKYKTGHGVYIDFKGWMSPFLGINFGTEKVFISIKELVETVKQYQIYLLQAPVVQKVVNAIYWVNLLNNKGENCKRRFKRVRFNLFRDWDLIIERAN